MIDTKVYGSHLLLDCYGANPKALQDSDLIYQFLDELPAMIGMEKVEVPHVVSFDDPEKAGVTGIIMIITSHISIHTYSLKKCFFLDVFSCKDFDPEIVIAKAKETFEFTSSASKFVERGSKFPKANLV